MKINSENLYEYINEVATNETVKFKVFHDDDYVTEVYWDGENFNWESGTFTSGAFFDPFYDFVPIEEDKKIEKLEFDFKMIDETDFVNKYPRISYMIETQKNMINKLIDEVNKLKEKE